MKDDIDHKTLLCDEDLFLSSPISSPKQGKRLSFGYFPLRTNEDVEDKGVDREELLMESLRREKDYTPCQGYMMQLEDSTNLCTARSKAVHYIIDVCNRLGLAATTVFNAVNYLDRFLSMNSCMKWEIWMVELLSIACASLACKFYETCMPSLYDLQMENLEHAFKAITIQEMELMVLKALDWRLSCVTAFSFANLMLGPTRSGPTCEKVVRLLLHALLDPLTTKFRASIVAMSALKCVTKGNDVDQIAMFSKININDRDHVENCVKILETHLLAIDKADGSKHCSPVSVIPTKDNILM